MTLAIATRPARTPGVIGRAPGSAMGAAGMSRSCAGTLTPPPSGPAGAPRRGRVPGAAITAASA